MIRYIEHAEHFDRYSYHAVCNSYLSKRQMFMRKVKNTTPKIIPHYRIGGFVENAIRAFLLPKSCVLCNQRTLLDGNKEVIQIKCCCGGLS